MTQLPTDPLPKARMTRALCAHGYGTPALFEARAGDIDLLVVAIDTVRREAGSAGTLESHGVDHIAVALPARLRDLWHADGIDLRGLFLHPEVPRFTACIGDPLAFALIPLPGLPAEDHLADPGYFFSDASAG